MKAVYTPTVSKVGSLTRTRSEIEPAFAASKQQGLNKLSDGGGFQFSSCRRRQKPTFEIVGVYSAFGKRIFDIFFSLVVILAFSPLFFFISIGIKVSSKGPIFYRSKRIGRNGKIITCLKFRTMHIHAEKELEKILQSDSLARKEWRKYSKLKKDPRITSIGKVLRKTSLDELPQFFNVLIGSLSVVGPRPITEEEWQQYLVLKGHEETTMENVVFFLSKQLDEGQVKVQKAQKILSVKPGITGLWQTSGRNRVPFKWRMKLEEKYIAKQSFFFDLLLIIKTIPAVLSLKNAY